jgi:hypothetical protein
LAVTELVAATRLVVATTITSSELEVDELSTFAALLGLGGVATPWLDL